MCASVWPVKSCQLCIKVALNDFTRKMKDFDNFTNFPKNCGQINCCHRLWKDAQSAINRPIWSSCTQPGSITLKWASRLPCRRGRGLILSYHESPPMTTLPRAKSMKKILRVKFYHTCFKQSDWLLKNFQPIRGLQTSVAGIFVYRNGFGVSHPVLPYLVYPKR